MMLMTASSLQGYFAVGAGLRQDHLDWNIAAPGHHPDVLSELKWKEIKIWQVNAEGCWNVCDENVLLVRGDYGKVFDGKNCDSDYAKDHRRGLFLKSKNAADKGEVFDVAAAIGRSWTYCEERLILTPFLGCEVNSQKFTMSKGYQTVNVINGYVGPFHGLNSSYLTHWATLWAGLRFKYEYNEDMGVYGDVEYHQGFYHAKGKWNLRADLPDGFTHKGHALGYQASLGLFYRLFQQVFVEINAKFSQMYVNNGVDHTKVIVPIYSDSLEFLGEQKFNVKTRLNDVNWTSLALTLFVSYDF